jgi:hypothetical protein
MKILLHLNKPGFTAVSVLIALSILAAMATSVLILVATNQSTRTNQLHSDQAFYSSMAGIEYAMQQIMVGGNPNPIPIRYFMGQEFNISRTCNKINITSTFGTANSSYSIADPGQLCATSGSATPSSNSAPFNGQSIAQGSWIWFNASFTFSGAGSSLAHIYLSNSNVLFTANSINYNVVIPSAVITLDPSATCVSTEFVANQWHTTVPLTENGRIFLSGVGFYVPVNLPGSISPVTWTSTLASDQSGLSAQWRWGAAVYTTSLSSLNNLGVKASDSNTCNDSSNSRGGTPKNVTSYHTLGARCGDGNDYVCQGSGNTGTVVQCASGC